MTPPVMPPRPGRPADQGTADAAELLSGYLNVCAADLLRSLRLHGESAGSAETAAAAAEAVARLRGSARRLRGTLHTYRPLLETSWADHLAVELRWLSDTLSCEYGLAARLDRLRTALHRLASDGDAGTEGAGRSGSTGGPGSRSGSGPSHGGGQDTLLTAGTARAAALLERQLTLARTRAHTAALRALVSGRFHAVADAVAVLAYEVPLARSPQRERATAATALVPLAEQAWERLAQAVAALPPSHAELPYQADVSARPVTARTSRLRRDAAWHETRRLLRLHRYAEEVLLRAAAPGEGAGPHGRAAAAVRADEVLRAGRADSGADRPDGGDVPERRLASATAVLDRHRDAVEAAEAAAAAARTPRIAPATAYALGVLHADQRQEAEAARLAFGRLWHTACRPLSQAL